MKFRVVAELFTFWHIHALEAACAHSDLDLHANTWLKNFLIYEIWEKTSLGFAIGVRNTVAATCLFFTEHTSLSHENYDEEKIES